MNRGMRIPCRLRPRRWCFTILALLLNAAVDSSLVIAQIRIIQKLETTSPAPQGRFGTALALHDSVLLVGAPGETSDARTASGAVYVFEKTLDGTWNQRHRLTPSDPAEDARFGWSVAVTESLLIVGAPGDPNAQAAPVGAVYVFERTKAGPWPEVARLTPAAGASYGFGHAISANQGGPIWIEAERTSVQAGPTVLVGAPRASSPHDGLNGRAYLFERRPDGEWQEDPLDAPWSQAAGSYGQSVALCFGRALVGAPLATREDGGTGRVQALERRATGWIDAGEVWDDRPTREPTMAATNRFGHALTCNVYVGAPGNGQAPGLVTGHGWGGGEPRWLLHTILEDEIHDPDAAYGTNLDEQSEWLVVTRGPLDGASTLSGTVDVLERGPGLRYQPLYAVAPPVGSADAGFGAAVATNRRVLAVGAPFDDAAGEDAGAVYLFAEGDGVSSTETPVPLPLLRVEPMYPNPVADNATLYVHLGASSHVVVAVYDAWGRRAAQVDLGLVPTGMRVIRLDTNAWPSGVYFYVISAGAERATGRMVRVR